MDDFSDLTIVIPTLNEGRSISRLINLLTKSYRGVSIIVSDDGSTDGTAKAVRLRAGSNRRIRLLDRKNRGIHGLAASIIDAAMEANTDKLIVMDGDMQHPYKKVGEIARTLDNYDIVVGVRSRVKNWGMQRRIVSKAISSFAYFVFSARGIPTCSDMMSGFFGMRVQMLKSLIRNNRDAFVYKGYKILLDILKVADRGIRIAEVGYDTFDERKYGKSKLSLLGINHASDTLKSILG